MTNAQVSASYVEGVTTGVPASDLSSVSINAATYGTPQRRVTAVHVAAATYGTPQRRISALYLEVLVPTKRPFIGWGIPVQ